MRFRSLLIFAAVCLCAAVSPAQTKSISVQVDGQTTVSFSATPTFDANKANAFKLVLTGNVTSSTLINADAGQELIFDICQDGTGSRTFVPPANVLNWSTISSTASTCSVQFYTFDGTNALPDMMPGLTGDVISSPGSTATTVVITHISGATTNKLAKFNATGNMVNSAITDDGVKISSTEPYAEVEAAAPSGIASSDLLYADSTAHRWKMINNNGTAKTLAATDGDTLTNTTLQGAASGNTVTNLAACTFGASSAIVGTGAAANVFTCTVPGGTFAAGKGLKVTLWVNHSTGTANVTYQFVYAGTGTSVISSTATGALSTTVYFMNNPGSTAAQQLLGQGDYSGGGYLPGPFAIAYTKDSTVNQTMSITFNVANTDQVTPLAMITEVVQ